MQVSAHSQPTQILYVSREFWKPGSEAALNRIEAKAARTCIQLGVPHPYLGIESLTGSKEVWYLNGFTSSEEMSLVAEQYSRNPALLTAMKQFNEERAEFMSESDKQSTATYRQELSHGVRWSIGQGRFLVIGVSQEAPLHGGTVFETPDGERFTVTAARTRTEADATLLSAVAGVKIFAIRPDFSMPAAEWVADDPVFWGVPPPQGGQYGPPPQGYGPPPNESQGPPPGDE